MNRSRRFREALAAITKPGTSDAVLKYSSELVSTALAKARPGMTDLQRVERDRAKRILSSLRNLRRLEEKARRANERYEDLLRSVTLNPSPISTEDFGFLNAAGRRLMSQRRQTQARFVQASHAHFALVTRQNRVLAAAKARAAKAGKAAVQKTRG